MEGYSPTGKVFAQFDLSKLAPSQALAINTTGDITLHVTVPHAARFIIAGNRVCLTNATVSTRWNLTHVATGGLLARQASRIIHIDEFWQYDTDRISNRVQRIELYARR